MEAFPRKVSSFRASSRKRLSLMFIIMYIDCIDCNMHFFADGSSSTERDERKTFGF